MKKKKLFQEGIIQNEEYGVLCLKVVFTCHSNKSFSIVAGRIEGMISWSIVYGSVVKYIY